MPAICDSKPPVKPTRHAVSKAARRALRSLMDRFVEWLEKLASSNVDIVEATHQLRVTSRRADVALRVFKDWLPRDARKSMRCVLKQIRFDAGIIRDLDLLELQWRPLQGEIAGQASASITVWMHQRILTQRDQARRELSHWTHRSNRAKLKRRYHSLVRRIRHRGGVTASASLAAALQRLVTRLQELLPKTAASLNDSHQTRIAARHLRYALELLPPFLVDEPASLGKLLTQLQDHLGAINDEATAIQHLMTAMESCREPQLLPELQQQLERTQLLAAQRLASSKADLSVRLQQLEECLVTLRVR